MSAHPITVDMDTVKLIASAAAEAAAKEVAQELREQMREDFARMDRSLGDKMDAYFGQLDPAKHVVQHDRMERLLGLMDRMSENVFTNLLSKLLWGLMVAGVIGYLAWQKITGGAG